MVASGYQQRMPPDQTEAEKEDAAAALAAKENHDNNPEGGLGAGGAPGGALTTPQWTQHGTTEDNGATPGYGKAPKTAKSPAHAQSPIGGRPTQGQRNAAARRGDDNGTFLEGLAELEDRNETPDTTKPPADERSAFPYPALTSLGIVFNTIPANIPPPLPQ